MNRGFRSPICARSTTVVAVSTLNPALSEILALAVEEAVVPESVPVAVVLAPEAEVAVTFIAVPVGMLKPEMITVTGFG